VVLDHREVPSGLADRVASRWPSVRVGCLEVGDVRVGPRVLIERKTLSDFAASVRDGRLFRQAYALVGASSRPMLILEGTDASDLVGVSPESLRGLLLSLAIGYRVPVLRTSSVEETAEYLARIARREQRRRWKPGDARVVTEGARALDVLAAIPGVGESRALSLLGTFGSVAGVAAAEEKALRQVEGIGRVLARALVRILRGAEARPPPPG
jgi:Fanconi anemia group M protein